MAKMFYTIDEAAEKLGISSDQVSNLASEGKLQQFRDRDKLMFKREQVDAMAANAASFTDDEDERSTGLLSMADASSSVDEISLESSAGIMDAEPVAKKADPRQETGVSIFDADELEHVADPAAQTQVTETIDDEEELALQSIGSGSGLLDLTREADDTSLGAELLDEIYPGTAEGSDAKMESATGSSGVFDEAIAAEASASGLDNLASGGGMATAAAVGTVPMSAVPEVYDAPGSGFSSGMLFCAMIGLITSVIVGTSLVVDTPSPVTKWLVAEDNRLIMCSGGLLAASIIFGLIGFFIGKARAK